MADVNNLAKGVVLIVKGAIALCVVGLVLAVLAKMGFPPTQVRDFLINLFLMGWHFFFGEPAAATPAPT